MSSDTTIKVSGNATLVVAWRTGPHVHARMVKAGGEVMQNLLDHANTHVELLSSSDGREYDPDDEQGDATFLRVDPEELIDTEVLKEVTKGPSLALATKDDLRKRSISFYALVVGDTSANRTIFLRKTNPVKLGTKNFVAAMFTDILTEVSDPVFAFDERFDVIVARDGVWAFNQGNFELVFKDTDAVLARTGEWVDELSDLIPITDESKSVLATRLRTSSVFRRKIQSLRRKQHLSQLTPALLRAKMAAHGLDADRLMPDDKLAFDKANEQELILLLNEDLFAGDFSGEPYAVSRKARRSS